MRFFLIFALAMCLAKPLGVEKSNVVFIDLNDWGCADAGLRSTDFFETPNIDRLAGQGMRFSQACAGAAIYSPTRAAISTGKLPPRLYMIIWHVGAASDGQDNRRLLEAKAQPNLPRKEVTLTETFQCRGYSTAHIGRWHIGKAGFSF
jgi:arylsulfatase A-like enzyme